MNYNKIFIPGRFSPMHIGHQQMIHQASQHAQIVKVLITHGSEITERTPISIDTRVKIMKKTLELLQITKIQLATCLSFDPQQAAIYMQQALHEYHITKDFAILSNNPNVQIILSQLGYQTITISDISIESPIDICATKIRNMVKEGQHGFDKYLTEGTTYYRTRENIEDQITHYQPKATYHTDNLIRTIE